MIDSEMSWDGMSEEEQANALDLLRQLSTISDKYIKKEEESCEDSTLKD